MNGFTRIGDIIPALLEESILTGLGYLEPTEDEIEALNASLLERDEIKGSALSVIIS